MLFFILALVAVLLIISRLPSMRGWIGELLVKIVIGSTKQGEQYVINDFRLRTEDGKTSQVDHIVIRPNGVFVIETKNYSGRIYGKETQQEWTQVLNYGKVKNHFYNPIKQNKTHIHRINELLNGEYPLFSAVVFVRGNISYIQADGVYSLFDLKKLLARDHSVSLSQADMEKVYSCLQKKCEESNLSTAEHIQNINRMKENIDRNICPRCGGTLVQRSHNGSFFYGCSNYPQCRFTKR